MPCQLWHHRLTPQPIHYWRQSIILSLILLPICRCNTLITLRHSSASPVMTPQVDTSGHTLLKAICQLVALIATHLQTWPTLRRPTSSASTIMKHDDTPNHTVYPKKYAHGFCFAVLCCGYTLTDFPISIRLTSLALWQSNDCPSASKATLMNMDKYFMWIHYERLHNHNKAEHNKTVCIFLGIYCTLLTTIDQFVPLIVIHLQT